MRREVIGDCVLYCGDCLEVMPTLEADSADAVATDPPYHLTTASRGGSPRQNDPATPFGRTRLGEKGFMGKTWDGGDIALRPETWAAAFRTLKFSGYLLSFGGTRTFHRLACALEDAGFEMRDTLCWLHGQGFPKAKSCLKPAWEPILLCRKPGRGVLPLGIEECRIGYVSNDDRYSVPQADFSVHKNGEVNKMMDRSHGATTYRSGDRAESHPAGRWPANVILSHIDGPNGCRCVGTKRVKVARSQPTRGCDDTGNTYGEGNGLGRKKTGQEVGYADADGMEEVAAWECARDPETGEYICPVALLDGQSGESKSSGGKTGRVGCGGRYNSGWTGDNPGLTAGGFGDTGGASRYFATFPESPRFFYTPKASKSDRGEGNTHPTVKSTALMEWLVKLVCPPGGIVLDPFMGSGSTALACIRSGRKFIGCELNPEYFEIACKRIREEYAQNPLFEAI